MANKGTIFVVNCPKKFNGTSFFHRICVEVRFISPKLAQIFVRSKLELFNTYGIVAPRSFEYFQTGSYITAANITVHIDTETSGQPKKNP